MKVLIQTRPDVLVGAGGDLVQARKTADRLRALGVDVTLSTERVANLRGFDLVHLITLYTHEQARRAVQYGCPLVVSPVYWNFAEYADKGFPQDISRRFLKRTIGSIATVRRLKNLASAVVNSDGAYSTLSESLATAWQQSTYSSHPAKMFQWVISNAALLLPNSKIEGELLRRDFHVESPIVPVPNGVDERYDLACPRQSPVQCPRPYVLTVAARFNYRKNQLAVIKAIREATVDVVFVGRATNSAEQRYLDECIAQSSCRMTFITRSLAEDDLIPLYQQARVHVLASWFETPGLVSLEAAMAGCAIVSTDRGSAREYFGEFANYCSPDNVDSIREAVLSAWDRGASPQLREHVRGNFTWENVVAQTLRCYELALAKGSASSSSASEAETQLMRGGRST